MSDKTEQIWDPAIRFFHWALVVLVVGSWVLGKFATPLGLTTMTLHFWAGYAIAGLLAFRLVWGVIGPHNARWSSFVRGPAAVLAYLRELPARRPSHAAGHNPLGGWVISGSFEGSMNLAGSGASLTSRGGFDTVAARFSANGAHQWSFRYGDTGMDLGYGVATTPEGNVLLAGTFASSITFGTRTLTGATNAFVTRLSAGDAPTHEWAVGLGGADYDLAEKVAVGEDGSVYVLTLFNGMTDIAGTPFTSRGYDSWISALVK